MSEANADLFDDVELSLAEMQNNPKDGFKHRWSITLAELLVQTKDYLISKGMDEEKAQEQSVGIVTLFSDYGGGQPFYLPMSKKLKLAFRDHAIFNDFHKLKIEDMIKKYDLSKMQLYNIYHDQQALYIKKVQPSLL